jgi:hypothetical protein
VTRRSLASTHPPGPELSSSGTVERCQPGTSAVRTSIAFAHATSAATGVYTGSRASRPAVTVRNSSAAGSESPASTHPESAVPSATTTGVRLPSDMPRSSRSGGAGVNRAVRRYPSRP